MTTGEKFEKVADVVYEKGASDFGTHFDETGTNLVTIDKVHPKEHDVEVKLESKNLISPSVFADYELQEDGSYYAPHAKATNKYPFELPIGTYTLSYQLKAPANTGYRIFLEDENGTRYNQFLAGTGDFQSCVFTFSNTAKITTIFMSYSVAGEGVYFKDLQIERGTVATSYTPYVDVSTDAKSVTVCGKNLFDISVDKRTSQQRNDIELTTNDDGSFNLEGTLRNTNYQYLHFSDYSEEQMPLNVNIPKGTTLMVSVFYEDGGDGDRVGIGLYRNPGRTMLVQFNSLNSGQSQRYTATEDIGGISYIYLCPNKTAGDSIAIRNIRLQVEIGSVVTEWEAFKGGTYPVTYGKAIVKSVSPTMNITTPTSGVSIEAEGYLDGQAVIDELTQAIVDLGGEI